MACLRPHRLGQRYSPLAQITPANVGQLKVAWQFHTGDLRGRPGDPVETTYEVTPLKVGDRLFLCTPHQSVIALDATTGAQVWRYDPQIQRRAGAAAPDLPRPVVPAAACQRPSTVRRSASATAAATAQAVHAHGRRPPDRARPRQRRRVQRLRRRQGPDRPVGPHAQSAAGRRTTRTSPVVVTRQAGHRRRHGARQRVHARAVRRDPRLRRRHRRAGLELGLGQPGRHRADRAGPDLHAQFAQQLVDLAASTRRWAWSTCRWATSRPTSGAASAARRSRSIRPPSWRSIWRPARCAGCSRPCITTCGTTTCPSQPSAGRPARSTARTVPALVQPTKQGELFVLDRRTGNADRCR